MSLVNLWIAAREAVARWRRRQRAYAELYALDDRSLADIGLRREEIAAVVEGLHEATRRPPQPSRVPAFGLARPAGHRWLPPL